MDAKIAKQKVLLADEIEKLRPMINQVIVDQDISSSENMAISKKIDKLVVKYISLDKTDLKKSLE